MNRVSMNDMLSLGSVSGHPEEIPGVLGATVVVTSNFSLSLVCKLGKWSRSAVAAR